MFQSTLATSANNAEELRKAFSKTIPYAQDNQQQGIWKQISVDMRTGPSSFLCCCLRNPCDGSGSGSGGCRSNNNLAVTQQKGIVTVPTVIQINCNTLSFLFSVCRLFVVNRCVGLLVMAGWTPRLKAWCLHLHSINAIFYGRPSPYGRLSCLGKGFLLRCFQELS